MGKYESLNYTVIIKEHKFELRHYETYYTSSIKEKSLAGKSGFGVLFSYISGKNETNKKISMTVPVINELTDDMTMEFVVPKELYQDIPTPNDERVTIKKHPAKDVAVYRFSWFSNDQKIKQIQTLLLDWIKMHNYTSNGHFILARYNPPITPPCFRKNELMIEVIL